MNKDEINAIALDLIEVDPRYDYRFWDSENNRTLLATGANLAEYPEEITIICIEENQQICLSSLELLQPECKIHFQSKTRKILDLGESIRRLEEHIAKLKELEKQVNILEQIRSILNA